MTKIRTSLAVLFVLVFVVALSALLLGQDRTKPDPPYEDLGSAIRVITEEPEHQLPSVIETAPGTPTKIDWDKSKVAPVRPYDFHPTASPSALLTEDFEGGAVPPAGWTADTTNYGGPTYTWHLGTSSYEGSYAAQVLYDPALSPQDEYLISPAMDLSTKGSSWHVYFYWMMSYYWGVSPYDNYELELWISTDGGSSWAAKLWCEDDVGVFTNFTWYLADVDLNAYLSETDVKLGWRYYGADGAQAVIDYISVDTPPIGRCCYGDPMSPTCADVTEEECNTLAGTWIYGLDCTTPCPIAGVGDDCTNPILATLNKGPGDTLYKDLSQTTCGRVDDYEETCLGYYDGGDDIIYQLTVSSAVNVNIKLDPKGTTYTGICINGACPPGDPCMALSTNSGSSAHGIYGLHLDPGTYYIMIDTWPTPQCIPDFDLIITEAAAAPDNDECTGAPVISSFPTTVSGTTIGATVDCPGLLDWNAVWYKFELPYDCNDLYIDFCPTTDSIWTVGVVLYDECPPDCPGYILRTGYDWTDPCPNGYMAPQIWWDGLPAGSYWFPVYVEDETTNPFMNFSFEVSVTECVPLGPGNDCADPIAVSLPAALPYSDLSQTTCGRLNDYSSTCLGSYDNGEDIIYELTVTSAVVVDITLDPGSDAWTGIAIDDACPPSDPCMAYSTNTGASPHGMTSVALAAGTYYIMIDTWPSPICIQDFDLTITEAAPPPPNDECEDAVVVTDGETVFGTNISATIDCPAEFDNWHAVWYKFELPYDCNDVFVDYCPTTDNMSLISAVLFNHCPPPCDDWIGFSAGAFVSCPNGSYNPQIWWYDLPAGTYYLPVHVEPSMDFGFTLHIFECPPYCRASGGCDEYISNVQVGTINNSSGCNGYADYTGISTDMVMGTGYPITITIGNPYSADVGGLWVDWNQDFDFYDAGEQVTLDPGSGYGPYQGTITPPAGAASGNTVMRVRVQYTGTPAPCGATSYGEVEDYTINVINPPECNIAPPGPFNIAEGDVLSFTITVTDPDAGDIVTITGSGIPPGAVMAPPLPVSGPTPQSSTFNWATGAGDSGVYTVTFIVFDAGQLADTCTAEITVRPNNPPACDIDPPGSFNVYDGDLLSFVVTASDPDAGDQVTITSTDIPSGATMSPPLPASGYSPQSSTFEWTPSDAQVGSYTVNFTITDNHGFEGSCSVLIRVWRKQIPVLSQWGLIVLILLIVGAGILIMMKRKKVAVRK